MTASDVIKTLQLEPLPWEGGWFAETYRTGINIPTTLLGREYRGDVRQLGTAIYFLLTTDTNSRMHRVTSDEVFHFYLGDAVEQLRLRPDGTGEIVVLGHDLIRGQVVQTVVEGGVWQGARVMRGGSFALMGTTVTPGFSFDDFVLGDRETLQALYPEHAELVAQLC